MAQLRLEVIWEIPGLWLLWEQVDASRLCGADHKGDWALRRKSVAWERAAFPVTSEKLWPSSLGSRIPPGTTM